MEINLSPNPAIGGCYEDTFDRVCLALVSRPVAVYDPFEDDLATVRGTFLGCEGDEDGMVLRVRIAERQIVEIRYHPDLRLNFS